MKYLKQTDEKLNEEIQEFGCFFRCCTNIAEREVGKSLSADQINCLWKIAHYEGWIIGDDLKKMTPLIEYTINMLTKKNIDVYEVGTFKHGKVEYYGWTNNYKQYHDFNYLIQKIKTGNNNDHYRLVDKRGRVIFDPYHPAPKVREIYYSILFLI